jgi:hypothetical protein
MIHASSSPVGRLLQTPIIKKILAGELFGVSRATG